MRKSIVFTRFYEEILCNLCLKGNKVFASLKYIANKQHQPYFVYQRKLLSDTYHLILSTEKGVANSFLS